MRTILTTLFWFMACAADTSAQSTVAAGRARSADASLGYSYVSHTEFQSTQVGLNGIDASATFGFNSWLGIKGDLGYFRAANVLGTPSHSDVLSYLVGPVFYPTTQGRVRTYVHALFGGARVTGPVPVAGGFLIGSWATRFACAVGGGIEYQFSDSIGFRTGVDYLRTAYFGPSLTIQGQNNIKATVAMVYFFGSKRRRRR
jgi:opacity protein-like surface antigen